MFTQLYQHRDGGTVVAQLVSNLAATGTLVAVGVVIAYEYWRR